MDSCLILGDQGARVYKIGMLDYKASLYGHSQKSINVLLNSTKHFYKQETEHGKLMRRERLTMPKPRKLSKVEINYIKEHVDIPLESLLEQLPDVDKGEVSALLTHLKTKTTSSTVPASNVNNASDFNAGNLMGKRDGMSVMTPAASELMLDALFG
jgi:hypothetical protein